MEALASGGATSTRNAEKMTNTIGYSRQLSRYFPRMVFFSQRLLRLPKKLVWLMAPSIYISRTKMIFWFSSSITKPNRFLDVSEKKWIRPTTPLINSAI